MLQLSFSFALHKFSGLLGLLFGWINDTSILICNTQHILQTLYVPKCRSFGLVKSYECLLDLRSNSMLCSMLIIAAGYLVNCDFHAWRVAYDIFAAGLPDSV